MEERGRWPCRTKRPPDPVRRRRGLSGSSCGRSCRAWGTKSPSAPTAAAIKALEKGTFDAAILDLRMPGLTRHRGAGQDAVRSPRHRGRHHDRPRRIETAIEAMRLGAFDYITKPCKLAEIETLLCRVAERRELKNKTLALRNARAGGRGAA